MFVNARQIWLPFGTWSGLVSPVDLRKTIAIGVDVGLTSDTTAVAWAAPADDSSDRMVIRSHVWSAREDVPHHTFVPGGRVDLELVEDFIRELAGEYNVSRLHYDPRFFERSAQALSKEGMTVAPLNQNSAPMADAYHEFYVDARTGKFAHDGDAVLQSHVESAAGVKTERGWRVSKLKSNRRIDACVASAMALYGARRMAEDVKPWVGAV
jgi:phage terminase large subunit-like protein